MKAFYNNQVASELGRPVKLGLMFSFHVSSLYFLLNTLLLQFVWLFLNFPSHFLHTPRLPSHLTPSSPLISLFHFSLILFAHLDNFPGFLSLTLNSFLSLSLASSPHFSMSSSDLVWCVTGRGRFESAQLAGFGCGPVRGEAVGLQSVSGDLRSFRTSMHHSFKRTVQVSLI